MKDPDPALCADGCDHPAHSDRRNAHIAGKPYHWVERGGRLMLLKGEFLDSALGRRWLQHERRSDR